MFWTGTLGRTFLDGLTWKQRECNLVSLSGVCGDPEINCLTSFRLAGHGEIPRPLFELVLPCFCSQAWWWSGWLWFASCPKPALGEFKNLFVSPIIWLGLTHNSCTLIMGVIIGQELLCKRACLILWGLAWLADINCMEAIKLEGNVMWAEFKRTGLWHWFFFCCFFF